MKISLHQKIACTPLPRRENEKRPVGLYVTPPELPVVTALFDCPEAKVSAGDKLYVNPEAYSNNDALRVLTSEGVSFILLPYDLVWMKTEG